MVQPLQQEQLAVEWVVLQQVAIQISAGRPAEAMGVFKAVLRAIRVAARKLEMVSLGMRPVAVAPVKPLREAVETALVAD